MAENKLIIKHKLSCVLIKKMLKGLRVNRPVLIAFLCAMIIAELNTCAQKARIVLQNADYSVSKPLIHVKWYSQQFVYKDGVNVYRREYPDGRWLKIAGPLKQLPDLPNEIKQKDENLNVFVEVMKEAKPKDLTGLLLLNLMAESFDSQLFSSFLGIQYDDKDIVPGEKYQYKVTKISGTEEIFFVQSDSITARTFVPDQAPGNFFVRIAKKKVQLGWRQNDNLFYAVNVYRKEGNIEKKLNNRPVLLSQVKDSSGNLNYPEVKFTDDSVKEGKIYQYSISGVNFFGEETKRTSPFEIQFPDQTPPPAPKNLILTIHDYELSLSWEINAVQDLKGFYVYRSSDDKTYQRITADLLPRNTNHFTDEVPHNGGYYYYVSSVDQAGNQSPCLKQFKDVKDVFPPAMPQNVTAVSDTGKIIIQWKANTEKDLMGYLIYRQTVTKKKGGDFVLITANPTRQTTFVNYLPKNIKNTFLYRVVAIDTSYNKSEYSNIAGIRMPDVKKPDKPYIKNIIVDDESVVIEWIANVDPDLKGYNLYRGEKNGNELRYKIININLIDPLVTRYTDKWVQKGIPYNYYLIAIDSSGNESVPSDLFEAFLPGKDAKLTSQVKNLKVRKRDKDIELEWQLTNGPDFAGCVLYRSEEDSEMKPVSGMLSSEKFIDNLNEPGHIFYYQVKVFDKNGNKSESERVRLNP